MSNEKVKQTSEMIIGTKQTVKAIKSGIVQEIIVAKDADDRMTEQIIQLALEKGIRVGFADSRLKLGKAYGINVGAAAVAITG
ncbi:MULTISPECIES: ribosomal L7Ae/L30e/S12e/Gadd45 family protein [Planococcus]|uniref:Ribosomal protein L7Ae-like protein n=1 Tax=Planococcus faecalis TaxID=1598147 RepID=A0ABN4XDI8_9BACL|nr:MULTISPECIES: ribosomal L7Ae/L30e/S12e/Gadd45 family protein [Planococcus]AQU77896.1 ribosomal protein L7Ae-like protein [Planococcus faecalis]MDJ0332769.1 ribosomal L7Ae/L30e/S12e/Gadd45 family protein [Planococcus sp. S3-L1]OHX54534.1 ribosomal protein L7Ae-like protein [Planococcus faecalis]